MNGSSAKAVLTLALVFIAGAAVGIAGDRLDLIPRAAEATVPVTPAGTPAPAGGQTIIEEFADELALSPEQRMEIDLLLDYYAASLKDLRQSVRPKYRALMDSVRVEILEVLDDEQRTDYQALLDDRYGSAIDGPSDSNEESDN
jgi:hypothetical protein